MHVNDDACVGLDADADAQHDSEQRAVGDRIAEIRHAPPHHEAAERRRGDRHAEAARERACEEVVEHRARSVGLAGRGGLAGYVGLHQSHRGGRAVTVVVLVGVDRQRRSGVRAEQRNVFGMPAHRLRLTGAADVPVDADDAVRWRPARDAGRER